MEENSTHTNTNLGRQIKIRFLFVCFCLSICVLKCVFKDRLSGISGWPSACNATDFRLSCLYLPVLGWQAYTMGSMGAGFLLGSTSPTELLLTQEPEESFGKWYCRFLENGRESLDLSMPPLPVSELAVCPSEVLLTPSTGSLRTVKCCHQVSVPPPPRSMVITLIRSDYCCKLFTQLGVGLCFGETDSWTLRVILHLFTRSKQKEKNKSKKEFSFKTRSLQ